MKKSKQLPLILGLLSAVSLGTVGFSAWVINATTSNAATGDITVQVGDLQDDRILITSATLSSGNNSVNFDAPQQAVPDSIFKEVGTEDLDFAFTLVIDSANPLVSGGSFVPTMPSFVFSFGSNSALAAASTLIEAPTTDQDGIKLDKAGKTENYTSTSAPKIAYSAAKLTNGDKTATIDFTCHFRWGSKFNYKNPANTYKSNATQEELNEFKNDLALIEAVNASHLKLTVSTKIA